MNFMPSREPDKSVSDLIVAALVRAHGVARLRQRLQYGIVS